MSQRSWVAVALMFAAGAGAACKKDASGPAGEGSATAVVKEGPEGTVAGGSGSAVAVAAAPIDPWAGPPPGSDTTLGADCGPKLNKIDPWAGSPTPPPKLDTKVDVSMIEKPIADKVQLKDFGGVTASGFRVTYNPSRHKNHEEYRALFQSNKMFDEVAEGLNRTVRLPKAVEINTVSCNTINAFYDPLSRRIIVCYELLDYFVGIFKPEAKSEAELGNAVMGATMFGFFHEVGHGLIDLLELPAVGREEDSVDQLATLILIASGDEGVSQALAGAYWFQLQSKGTHTTPFWDEHAFDQQRFYNITCLIFGSDPKKHADFIKSGTLPMERAMRCPDEYAKIKKAWEKLLQPHLTNGAALNMNYKPNVPVAEAPKTTKDDPWTGDPSKPVAGEPTPPAPPTPVANTITCEQVAEKAAQLIGAEAEARARSMSADARADLKTKMEVELPAAIEKIILECAKASWTDMSRRCVLEAKTLAQASKCQ
ncbi:MAG: DUF4344 domain-containing metallopeptidase [Deltaproteobacteria bacterium]|nr:DUF4344 domain-containing metallopeptidase [Deltaproteobacteria bacterium]